MSRLLPTETPTSSAPRPGGRPVTPATGAIMELVRSVEGYRRREAVAAGLGVTEMRALTRIWQLGSASPKQLAESLELNTGTVTALIDRIESAGFVRRVPSARDRRMIGLELTDPGLALMDGVLERFEAAIGSASGGLEGPEAETVVAFLRHSIAAVDRIDTFGGALT